MIELLAGRRMHWFLLATALALAAAVPAAAQFSGGFPVNGSLISGSAQNARTTGTTAAGSAALGLAATLDFQNGQGILVNHAGTAYNQTQPAGLRLTVNGTAGATTYAYRIAGCDKNGGVDAALAAVTSTTGPATLTGTNYIGLSWSNGSNYCTLIWRSTSGGGYQFVARTIGTSYNDGGLNDTAPFWAPAMPPASAVPDYFVTTIGGGAQTAALILAAPVLNAVAAGTYVQHDDTAALQAAVNAATRQVNVSGPTGNFSVAWAVPAVQLQGGARVQISSTITLPYDAMTLIAQAGSANIEMAGLQDLFAGADIRQILVRNLNFVGGGHQFNLANINEDAGYFRFEDAGFFSSADVAVVTSGAYSTVIDCENCTAFNVDGFIAADTDVIKLEGGWWQTGYSSWRPNRAWVAQTHTDYYNQMTWVHGVTGVPAQYLGYLERGVLSQGNRWFDIAGTLASHGNRWGGEGGGIPVAEVTSTLSASTGPQIYQGAQLDITDGLAYGGPTAGMTPAGIVVLNGVPAAVHLAGNMGPSPGALVAEAPGFSFAAALSAWKTAAGISDATPYIDFNLDVGGGRFDGVTEWPAAVAPYVRMPQRLVPPTSCTGQPTGTIWNNSGVANICP